MRRLLRSRLLSLRPEKPRSATPLSTVIRRDKKKVCEVSSRNGIVGVRFFANIEIAQTDRWAQEISEFIEGKLKSTEK